jgi:hypothetical protein
MLFVAIRTAAWGETAGGNINDVTEVNYCEGKPVQGFHQMIQAIMQ